MDMYDSNNKSNNSKFVYSFIWKKKVVNIYVSLFFSKMKKKNNNFYLFTIQNTNP